MYKSISSKIIISVLIALSISGCAEQLPARVEAAKPSFKRTPVKSKYKSQKKAPQPMQTPAQQPAASSQSKNSNATVHIPNPKPLDKSVALNWVWPAKGAILSKFSPENSTLKGIDISGSEGAPVLAASDGEVVYSGNSLRGYGNLIIIKHKKNFLSAYAHNRKNMVKEGDRVVVGQRIAEMGQTGTDKVKLHFEVRYQGKPVDPQGVLPRR